MVGEPSSSAAGADEAAGDASSSTPVSGGAGAASADPSPSTAGVTTSVDGVPGTGSLTASEPTGANEVPDEESDEEDVPDDDDFACADIDNSANLDGSDTRLQVNVVTCVERWRAAGPESRKKMFALFAITGVFVSVCRHGHPLVICDMIRSGELCVHSLPQLSVS